jgi:3-methyl-2-oxobutanoate hydroxymethyltransferase
MGLTINAPRFAKAYADLRTQMKNAADAWVADVSTGVFPGPEHTFH